MTARFSKNKVKNAAIEAMFAAVGEYTDWTEKEVKPWRVPERFYQVKIAEQIRQLPFDPAVFLEYNAKDAVQARPGRPPELFRGKKKIDIVVAPKNIQPFQIAIEIKHSANRWDTVKPDVERLRQLVRHNSQNQGIRMALSLFLIWHPLGSKGEGNFENQRHKFKENIKEYRRKYRDIKLSLVAPEKGDEFKIETDNGETESYAWYVSGLSIVKR